MDKFANITYSPFMAPAGTVVDRIHAEYAKVDGGTEYRDYPPGTLKTPAINLASGDYVVTVVALTADDVVIGAPVVVNVTVAEPPVEVSIPSGVTLSDS